MERWTPLTFDTDHRIYTHANAQPHGHFIYSSLYLIARNKQMRAMAVTRPTEISDAKVEV